jgi:Zn-dependent alcohol dehydrogenase
MDARAAVAWEAGKPLAVEKAQLAGPKAGEVLVEIKATGVCHTNIDDLITHVLPLERINDAFELMHEGKSIRSVVVY